MVSEIRNPIHPSWVTPGLYDFFTGELENERFGGTAPATVSSSIDSLTQGGADVFGLVESDLLMLLLIADQGTAWDVRALLRAADAPSQTA